MYKERTVSVVVPAHNEESKIGHVLETMPKYVDRIYVIDDCSSDNTAIIVASKAELDSRIKLIELKINRGVGGAIVEGYQQAIEEGVDIAVVMAGDGQMDPSDLENLLNPIVDNECDYVKGNRFLHPEQGVSEIPKHRLFGNMALSILTKIASGYWHLSDSQCGYTSISRKALLAVDWKSSYPRYGCPNDYLARLNIANIRVMDVPVKAVYGPNWTTKMRVHAVFVPMLKLLFKLFCMRMFRKYVVANGHPIVLFYLASFLSFMISIGLFFYIGFQFFSTGVLPQTAIILWVMFLIVGIQLTLNAFDMDFRDNQWLFAHANDAR